MRIIADLQIHSKYSRACSQDLVPANISAWAEKKGIGLVGTGDFTHPKWLELLKENLEEEKSGLYQLHPHLKLLPSDGAPHTLSDKVAGTPDALGARRETQPYFMLTAEVSNIYKQGDKVRRIHNMIFAPNFGAVDKIREGLEKAGANLKADGRPIMGIHCDDLVKIVKEADERAEVIPAHAWTPHFGLFGSLSGFDSVEEAFKDQTKYIFAIETGLSSDPKMNWQISSLDRYSLISNSDAHSLRKIGREANVFDIEPEKISYDEVIRIIRNRDPKEFLYTVEFFPEEGKYHLDGHRDCKFSCLPSETERLGGICPVCGKKLLVGVLNRVNVLADRDYGFVPKNSIPFKNIIPLEEIIAEILEVSPASKKVQAMYEKMTNSPSFAKTSEGRQSPTSDGRKVNEFEVLLDLGFDEIASISNSEIATSVMRVREGRVHIEGGYDGVFGKVHIYGEGEKSAVFKKPRQASLF